MLDGSKPEIETSPDAQARPIRRIDLTHEASGITHRTISVGNNVLGGMVIAGLDQAQIVDLFPEARTELAVELPPNADDES